MLNGTNVRGRNFLEIGFFWDKAADEADDIFDRALLPGVVGVTKERLRVEGVVDVRMEIIFGAVVVGDGAARKGRVIEKS